MTTGRDGGPALLSIEMAMLLAMIAKTLAHRARRIAIGSQEVTRAIAPASKRRQTTGVLLHQLTLLYPARPTGSRGLDRTQLRWPGRDQKTGCDFLEFFSFIRPGIATVSTHYVFLSMQQPVYLRDIGHVRCCTVNVVDKARCVIHANVRLHPDIPLIALLRLMHLLIALTAAVFCRTRCSNQCCIDDGPAVQAQSLAGKMGVDLGK